MEPARDMFNRKGVTLVELMITIALLGIVTAIIYATYIYSVKSTVSHRLMSEMHTDTRAALEFMSRELKMMGYEVPMDCAVAGTPQDDGSPTYPTDATRYGPVDYGPKLVRASGSEVVFAFKDLSVQKGKMDDGTDNLNLKQYRLIRYWLDDTTDPDNKKIKRETYRWDDDATKQWQLQDIAAEIIENVTEFNLVYRKANGDVVGAGGDLTYSERCDVRGRIEITVKTGSKRDDPVTGAPKDYELSTAVNLKNMGKSTKCNEDDDYPPEPEIKTLTNLQICGMLYVEWEPSAAADLEGYLIEVTSGGKVSQYTTPPTETSAEVGGYRPNYDTCVWTPKLYNNQDATVTVTAFDDCNLKSTSSPVTTHLSVNAPQLQPKLSVSLGSPDAKADITNSTLITLEWAGNETFPPFDEYDVDYDVFRMPLGGTTWERRNEDPATNDRIPICNTTSYQDTFAPQQMCTTFKYKVRAVNVCDTTLFKDSEFVFGDGVLNTTNGSGFEDADKPSAGVTNTRPSEDTPPDEPWGDDAGNVSVKAGYRKNYIKWNNPAESDKNADLDHVAVRFNELTEEPVFPTDWPDTNASGTAVPEISGKADESEYPGTFGPGAIGLAVTHGEGGALSADNWFTYSLFSVDKCGNSSGAASTGWAKTQQCSESVGEAWVGAPYWAKTALSGVSSANFSVKSGGTCGGNYVFTWNRMNDSTSGWFDLAGYYVYRDDTGTGFSKTAVDNPLKYTTLLTQGTGDPVEWSDLTSSPSTDDNPLYHGNTFMYYVAPIDCVRETHASNNPYATATTDVSPEPLLPDHLAPWMVSETLTVSPGRVTFNKPIASQLTYYDSNPSNPYIVSGDLDLSTYSSPSSGSGYQHNTVDFYAYNESAEDVTLNSMRLSWSNGDAYLSELRRTDTDACIYGTCAAGGFVSSPATLSGLDLVFKGLTDKGGSCTETTCMIPFKAVFTDSAGTVTSAQDMREDTLDISNLTFMKTFDRDGAPLTESCTHADPKVSFFVYDDIVVPLGPEIKPEGGVFQEEKNDGTIAGTPSTVIGGDMVPSSYGPVNVRIHITNAPSAPLTDAYLYYTTTKQSSLSPPSDISDYYAILLEPQATPGTYRTQDGIPVQNDLRVWYFMLAKDSHGNWDRHPEMENTTDFTAFTYDQNSPCISTPSSPTAVILDSDATTVFWEAPTTNTNTFEINDLAGFYVYQSLDGAIPTPVATIDYVSGQAAYSYPDASMLDSTVVRYEISAFDECAPPNESAAATSDEVIKGCANTPEAPTNVTLDGSATEVSWTEPLENTDGSPLNDLAGFYVYQYLDGVLQPVVTLGPLATSYIDTSMLDGTSVRYEISAFDECASPNESAAATSDEVIKGCDNTPGIPTNEFLDDSATTVSWTAPSTNDDGTTIDDLAGFYVLQFLDGVEQPVATINYVSGQTDYSHTDTSVPGGTKVMYKISAFDKCDPPNVSAAATTVSVYKGCDNTPGIPTNVLLDGSATTVSWTAPSTNDDGTTIDDLAGFYVLQFLDGVPQPVATINYVFGQTDYSHTDTSMSGGTVVKYEISAFDKCPSPGPNVSVADTTLSETRDPCVDTPGIPTLVTLFSNATTVSWTAPSTNDDGTTLNDLAGFYVYQFLDGVQQPAVTINYVSGQTDYSHTDASMPGGTKVMYKISAFDECAPPKEGAAETSLAVIKGCDNVPGIPTNELLESNATTVTWTAPIENTDNSTIDDLAGFYVYQFLDGVEQPVITINYVSGQTDYSHSDASMPAAVAVMYRISAFDKCDPPNEGAAAETLEVIKGCDNTPDQPGPGTPTLDANATDVSWTVPAFNDDGITPLDDLAGFYVYQFLDGVPQPVTSVGPLATSYSDASMPYGTSVMYEITAFDKCPSPGSNESEPLISNTVVKGCDSTPKAPTSVTLTDDGTTVNWVDPFENIDGTALNDLVGLDVRR
jgi:prepilin-type N-terminal cleavage/methylation domain-containing protein